MKAAGAEAVPLSFGIAGYPAQASVRAEPPHVAAEALLRAKPEGRGRCAIYVVARMVLKSNYYSKASLARLAKLASRLERAEASLLREALDGLIERYRDRM